MYCPQSSTGMGRLSIARGVPARTSSAACGTSRFSRKARDIITPAVVLAPLVGFDGVPIGWAMVALFRPHTGGVGAAAVWDRRLVEFQCLETICPQPFDIPMDLILTEAGNSSTNPATLCRVDS
jgi:5-formyltetrahydrofolate cyclo-ligase